MIKRIGLIVVSISLLVACTSTTNNEAGEEQQHHHDHEEMVLNDGEKWKVVDQMMGFIRMMEEDVQSFSVEGSEYEVLADSLQANVKNLTSNCTMTGQAHDELHKWLVPYMDLVDELEKSASSEEAKAVYEKLETSFEEFNQFFE